MTSFRIFAWVALATALVVLPAFQPAAAESQQNLFIQPGTGLRVLSAINPTHDNPCTVGYLLKDSVTGTYWATTAGHCDLATRRVAHVVYGEWGHFVWSNYQRAPNSNVVVSDIGLIQIHAQFQDNVQPAIAGWGGPTGIAASGTALPGALVGHTGTPLPGNDASSSGGIRRSGFAIEHTATTWSCQCIVQGGDSGGPFIHVATGLALGQLSGKRYEPTGEISTDKVVGSNFANDLARIHAAGWPNLQLATAPYTAPP